MRIRRLASPTTLIVGVIVLVLLVAFLPVLSLAHQLSLGSTARRTRSSLPLRQSVS
jgi:hypothetical protein